MRITIRIRNIYGRDVFYPVCDKARIFASIAGTSTLTRETLQSIRALGFSIEIQREEVKL